MVKKLVFVACSALGYLIGHFFGPGAISVYASIMISYHLYLAYLVVTAEKEAGLSLPIANTILTHVACVALVVLLAMGRQFIPFFGIVRLLIPAVAPFEADWLFSGGKKKPLLTLAPSVPLPEIAAADLDPVAALAVVAEAAQVAAPAPIAALAAAVPVAAPVATSAPAPSAPNVPVSAFSSITAAEYEEFLEELRTGKRPFRKPGITVREEFERWHGARVKKRHAAPAGSTTA